MTTSLDRCGCGAAVSPPTVLCWTCAGERRTLPNAKPAEPPACLPGCRPVYSVRIMSGPIQGDQIDHWPNCPNTPKLAAEPPACGCFGPCGNPDCCELCTEPESEPPNNPWDVDRIANVYADEDVSAPGMAKPLARAYLSLKAERDILKLALAEESGYLKRASAERDALKSRLAEESEPRIEHRDVCHASYPCEDCGKVRSRAEGGTTFTVCDDCWDKRQSEPPIADGVGVGIANLFMGHEAETAGKVLARAYLSLKAERDALRAENAAKYEEIASERHSYILLEAERQRLYDGNAALKARVEELEGLIATVQHAAGNCICVLCVESRAIRARRQEASNGK